MTLDRREFLEKTVAAAMAAGIPIIGEASQRPGGELISRPLTAGDGVYNPSMSTNSSIVSEQIAYAINMKVPRTQGDGDKWGYRGQILEISAYRGCTSQGKGNYVFTVQNEFRSLADPIRMMTSVIHIGQNPQVSVMRDDTLSTLVDSPLDDNYMRWIFKRPSGQEVAGLEIDNLRRSHPNARTEFTYNLPRDLGINLENIADTPVYEGDMRLFHRALRFVGDPHSIHTVRQTGEGIDGHGTYETVGYRIEEDQTRGPIMAARIDMVSAPRSENGLMTRIDERTRISSGMDLYNEFWMAYLDPNGGPGNYQGLVNDFKIATIDQPWARQAVFSRPKLQASNRQYW